MKYTILILCCLTRAVVSKPDLYKENENFQYSRSSSDNGQKSGFYAAQRGNMGGNYEKAKNMDNLANQQMSDLMHQVGTQLGVDPALLHSDGSRLNTHGNLYGSATASGTTYGQSSLADQRTGRFETLAHNTDASSLYRDTYAGYDHGSTAEQAHGSSFDRYGSNTNYAGVSKINNAASGRGIENIETGSGFDSAYKAGSSGSSYKSSGDSQSDLDSSYNIGTELTGEHQQSYNRPLSVYPGTPVRLAVRPGQVTHLSIPVTAQNIDSYQGSQSAQSSHADRTYGNRFSLGQDGMNNRRIDSSNVQAQNSAYNRHVTVADSDNAHSIYDQRDGNVQTGTSDNAQNYESQYSYRKEWEKHSATPVAVRPVVVRPAAVPLSHSIVPVQPQATRTMSINNIDETAADHSYSKTQSNYYASQNEQNSRYQNIADSRYRSDAAVSQESNSGNFRASGAGRDEDLFSAQNVGSATRGDVVTSAPKSYQSAYSYHKSWEHQGTPYVIKPAGTNLDVGLDKSRDSQRDSSDYSEKKSALQRSSAESHSLNYQQNMNSMHTGLSQQLSDSMDNLCSHNCGSGSLSKGYQAKYSYSAQRSYGAEEADENGHYRHVRSVNDRPKRYSYHNIRGDTEVDLGMQDVGQQLQDFGQQVEDHGQVQNFEYIGENVGQQVQDYGQMDNFDYTEDVGQQVKLDTLTRGQQLVDSDYQKLLQQNKGRAPSQYNSYLNSYENSEIFNSGQTASAPGHKHIFHYGSLGVTKPIEENKRMDVSQKHLYSHSYLSSTGSLESGLEKNNNQANSFDDIASGKHTDIYNTQSSKAELETPTYSFIEQYPSQEMHISHRNPTAFHNHYSSYPTSHYHTQPHLSQHSEIHQETSTEHEKEIDKIIRRLQETAISINTDTFPVALSTNRTQQPSSVTGHIPNYSHSSVRPHVTSYQYPTHSDSVQIEVKNTESLNVDKHETIIQNPYSNPKTPKVVNEKPDDYNLHREKTQSEIESLSLVTSDANREELNQHGEKKKQTSTSNDKISLTLQPPHHTVNGQTAFGSVMKPLATENYRQSNKNKNKARVLETLGHNIDVKENNVEDSKQTQLSVSNGLYSVQQDSHSNLQTTKVDDYDENQYKELNSYLTTRHQRKNKEGSDQLLHVSDSWNMDNHHTSQNHKESQSFSSTSYNNQNMETINQTLFGTGLQFEGLSKLESESNKTNNNDQNMSNEEYPRFNAHSYPSTDYSDQTNEEGQPTINLGVVNYIDQNKGLDHQENLNRTANIQNDTYHSETLSGKQEYEGNSEQVEDLGQQTINFDQEEDWGQQMVNSEQDLGQQFEDIGQEVGNIKKLRQHVEDLGQQVEGVGLVDESAQYGHSRSVPTNYRLNPREEKEQKADKDHELSEETSADVDTTPKPGFWTKAKDKASSWFG